ncbi:putative nucleotidyltransferase, ribonuclease H [Tanacetum coccineum]
MVSKITIKKAILDLGASTNILPASLVDRYDLGPLRKTNTIISLANRSTKIPQSIMEDVFVKNDDFYYPVDFLVMDIEPSYKHTEPRIILGRPFLATIDDRINCRTSAMYIAFGENQELLEVEEVQQIEEHMVKSLDQQRQPWSYKVEALPHSFDTATKPSLETPPTLELKHLPSHLKYAFLGANDSLHVIIASDLSVSRKEALLKPSRDAQKRLNPNMRCGKKGGAEMVLTKYKEAVGWIIVDLKWIIPSLCMHRIVTKPQIKPSQDAQRRLNPNMRDVVKNEVLKWLDAGSFIPSHTASGALRHLLDKKDAKPRLIRWILLLQEFDLEIRDKEGCENVVADHLSRITPPSFNLADAIKENFPDESLFSVLKLPWYANIVNYLAVKKLPEHWSKQQKNYFFSQLKYYIWEDPELYKMCADQVIRRCVPDHEHMDILAHCHSYTYGGYFSAKKTGHKVLQSGFFWPTIFKDAHLIVKACTHCQQVGVSQAILSGADNRPPMLEKDMYDSWKSIMELYMMNRQHGRMILESVENGPLIWPSIEENGVTRPKKYSELSATEAIQADCDIKATNIILQGLPPEVYALVSNHKVAKEL